MKINGRRKIYDLINENDTLNESDEVEVTSKKSAEERMVELKNMFEKELAPEFKNNNCKLR